MALPLFAVTLFVSAFLLFLVQPMVGKLILPKLGGTPQVWNTCMLFFQCALLAGYAYTHNLSTRLQMRIQLMVHGVLLGLPIAVLLATGVFDVSGWFPDPNGVAVLQALAELTLLVGVPFFVVSTSAPLLQKWFVHTGHPAASDPYFLYGASNLGSLLSLIAYPFLIEPWLPLRTQAYVWFGGYIGLIVLILACIASVWKSSMVLQPAGPGEPEGSPEIPVPPPEAPPSAPAVQPQASTAVKSGPAPSAGRGGITRKKGLKAHARTSPVSAAPEVSTSMPIISRPSDAPVTWFRRTRWILLTAVPSSLMLGVTSYISTDLSPFPLIWIVPLGLYLLSWILVFMKWPVPWTSSDPTVFTPHSAILYVGQPLCVLGLCFILLVGSFSIVYMFIAWAAFFATALACHGEFAKDRPNIRYLTEYFLLMSVGGALGGFLNAIIAPAFFWGVWEFYIALVIACFVRPALLETNWSDNFLMNSFPGMRTWAREQSDQLSRSFGHPPDGSTYVFSYLMDVILGLFMLVVAYFMFWQQDWGWNRNRAFNFLVFIGFGKEQFGSAERYFEHAYVAVVYGIPLIMCGLYSSRPVRFGLAVTALLTVNLVFLRGGGDDVNLYQTRTYFGVLRVLRGFSPEIPRDNINAVLRGIRRDDWLIRGISKDDNLIPNDEDEFKRFCKDPKDAKKTQIAYDYTYLMHGTTYHGRNYTYNSEKDIANLSRIATTYYHRFGPTGAVMEKFNWIPGPQNTYWADARMPTTIIGNAMADLMGSPLPLNNLVNLWSEPPYATIGLGTGTMASYCRPYQHLTFYEIDKQIREFSLPLPGGTAYFTYLLGAMRRGANLEITMGDARLSMQNPQLTYFPELKGDQRTGLDGEDDGGIKPHIALKDSTMFKDREHYYKAIEVDAFSSDAIPVHLITKEAIRMYLNKITYDGVVMVHTSNRHLDLVQPVGKIVEELDEEFKEKYKETVKDIERDFKANTIDAVARDKLTEQAKAFSRVKCLVGKDSDQRSKYVGHFSSEYVMVFYDQQYLMPKKDPPYALPPGNIFLRSVVHWSPPEIKSGMQAWTDDFSNLVRIMR